MDELMRDIPLVDGDESLEEQGMRPCKEPACCPVCGEALEVAYPDHMLRSFPGLPRTHSRMCACMRAKEAQEAKQRGRELHESKVRELREQCFPENSVMDRMTFSRSSTCSEAMEICKNYADQWENMRSKDQGLLLWGDVGTGKSFAAACIANALLEQEIAVLMINLSDVMIAALDSRTELLKRIRKCDLLIVDDFGMERETEFGMEIAFQVIDARYQTGKPMILTTNKTLDALTYSNDIPHKRIYDRILEKCIPVQFKGTSLRKKIRERKKEEFRADIEG